MAESYSVKAILSAKDSGFTSTMKSAGSALDNLKSQITGGLGFGLLTGAGQAAFSAITSGVKNVVSEINSSNAAWKTFEGNMSILGKSSSEIDSVKKELQSFAEQTVYSSSDMASTYAQLASVGVSSTTELVKGFGGLAAAAENPQQAMKTLSQQAVQMAAKPTVAWQDFKLMLEQTPAGIAAVAKEMGMSTSELVTKIQDGEIATDKFFEAIKKVGNSDDFAKLATSYKTVDQAMDGLQETIGNKLTPAFDVLSQAGIGAISGIIDKLGEIDGEAIAAKVKSALDTVFEYFNVAKEAFSGVGSSLMEAFNAIKESLSGVSDAFGNVASVESFASAMQKVADVIKTVAGFIAEHADQIVTLTKVVGAAVIAYKGFNAIKSINPFGIFGKNAEDGVQSAVNSAKKGKNAIAQIITSIADVIKNTGTAISSIIKSIGTSVSAIIKSVGSSLPGIIKSLGTATATAAKGIGSGLATALRGLGAALKMANPVNILATGAAIGIVVAALALLASQGGGLANIIQSIGNAFAVAAGSIGQVAAVIIDALAQALLTISPILPIIAASLVTLTPLVDALGAAVSSIVVAFGEALAAMSPFVEALGVAIGSIIVAIGEAASSIVTAITPIVEIISNTFTKVLQIISDTIVGIVEAIAPYLPEITSAFTTMTESIADAVARIVEAVAPYTPCFTAMVEATSQAIQAICEAFTALVEQIVPIIESVTELVSQLGTSICDILTAASETVASVGEAIGTVITSIGDAISGVLDSLANIIGSIGEAALNAGKGFEHLAAGIETIVALPILDMAASLTAVAVGIGEITLAAVGIEGVGEGMRGLAAGLLIAVTYGTQAAEVFPKIATALETLPESATNASAAMSTLAQSCPAVASATASMAASLSTANSSMGSVADRARSAGNAFAKMQNSVNLIDTALNKLSKTATTSMTTVITSFTNAESKAEAAGRKIGNGFTKGMKTELDKALDVAESAIDDVIDAFRSGYNGTYSAGAYISEGFAAGMRSCLSEIRSAANAMVEAAQAAVEAKAQIASPSKLFYGEGAFVGEGFANGIEAQQRAVWKAAEDLVAIPTVAMNDFNGSFAGELSEELEYFGNAEYIITIPFDIDGREFARATATYQQDELDRLQAHTSRLRGKV